MECRLLVFLGSVGFCGIRGLSKVRHLSVEGVWCSRGLSLCVGGLFGIDLYWFWVRMGIVGELQYVGGKGCGSSRIWLLGGWRCL